VAWRRTARIFPLVLFSFILLLGLPSKCLRESTCDPCRDAGNHNHNLEWSIGSVRLSASGPKSVNVIHSPYLSLRVCPIWLRKTRDARVAISGGP